jgi:hypothetical protein
MRYPSIPIDLSITHAFILITDDKNKSKSCEPNSTNKIYYRGGPLIQSFSDQILKGDSGSIVTKYGKYVPGTIDYPGNAAGLENQIKTVIYNNPGESIDKYDFKFRNTLTRIQAGNFKYFIPGPNSNTVAYQLLKDAGLPTSRLPFGVRPPGWEYDFWRDDLPKYNLSKNIPYTNLFPGLDNNLNPLIIKPAL